MSTTQGRPDRARMNTPSRAGARATSASRSAADRDTVRRAGAEAARAYPVVGSAALAPVPELDEPVRTRSAAERAEADARAARRAADRVAERVSGESRRRLRVAPPLPVTVARAPFVVMLISIVVVGVVGILVLTTMINANQFRLNNLQSQQTTLNQQQEQLQATLTQQSSPGNLLRAAQRLGLVPAGQLGFILPDGTRVGVPQPASSTAGITYQGPSSGSSAGTATLSPGTTNPASGSAGH